MAMVLNQTYHYMVIISMWKSFYSFCFFIGSMGACCSGCECNDKPSFCTWSDIKCKLRNSAMRRRQRRECPCISLFGRPKVLKIRRKIEECTCENKPCQDGDHVIYIQKQSPTPSPTPILGITSPSPSPRTPFNTSFTTTKPAPTRNQPTKIPVTKTVTGTTRPKPVTTRSNGTTTRSQLISCKNIPGCTFPRSNSPVCPRTPATSLRCTPQSSPPTPRKDTGKTVSCTPDTCPNKIVSFTEDTYPGKIVSCTKDTCPSIVHACSCVRDPDTKNVCRFTVDAYFT